MLQITTRAIVLSLSCCVIAVASEVDWLLKDAFEDGHHSATGALRA
jgi:hypothetical protein